MSTILNTLKKLEEEKSVLAQGVDLKKLVLQGEGATVQQQGRGQSRKWLLVSVLVLAGILLGASLMWFIDKQKNSKVLPRSTELSVPLGSAVSEGVVARSQSQPGIPLANIEESIEPFSREELFEEVNEPEFESASPIPLEELQNPGENELPAEIREIGSLIHDATAAALAFEEKSVLSLPVSQGIQIPSLKVRGIIFFNTGNPGNYILVSTPETKSRKLKVGESVLQATLKSIQPDKAVFFYRGEFVEVSIGG